MKPKSGSSPGWVQHGSKTAAGHGGTQLPAPSCPRWWQSGGDRGCPCQCPACPAAQARAASPDTSFLGSGLLTRELPAPPDRRWGTPGLGIVTAPGRAVPPIPTAAGLGLPQLSLHHPVTPAQNQPSTSQTWQETAPPRTTATVGSSFQALPPPPRWILGARTGLTPPHPEPGGAGSGGLQPLCLLGD